MTGKQYTPRERILAEDEGLRLKPYRDTVGKLTIGHGRNLDDKGISQDELKWLLENDGIRLTEAGALYLLRNDVAEANTAVARYLPDLYDPNENRVFALVCMAFNMGIGVNGKKGLLSFTRMLAALRRGDTDTAAREMLNSKWAKQVGPRRSGRLARIMRENELPE